MVKKKIASPKEFDSCIKFTCMSNRENTAFIDKKVSLRNRKVFTNEYFEPTDGHQYLHDLLAHPYHTPKSSVFSQTRCISKLCNFENDLENHKKELKLLFRKREYPEYLIRSEIRKVKFSNLKLK